MNHWIALQTGDTLDNIRACVQKGVSGIQSKWDWSKLEPLPAKYDFSGPLAEKALCDQLKVQYCLMVTDKTFADIGAPQAYNPLPNYLQPFSSSHSGNGWVANRWDAYVMGRFLALLNAACAAGIDNAAIQESSLGVDPKSYSEADYCAQLSRLIKTVLVKLRWYQNFLDSGATLPLDRIAVSAIGRSVDMGAPDILLDSPGFVSKVVPRFQLMQGFLPLFACLQNAEMNAAQFDRYVTYAQDVMGVDTVIWNRKDFGKPGTQISDALAWIAAHAS